ncbi:MAG: NUDIX domain-containing protein [Deltaproteobacteria bacterium]|nr:MAG: NUDIX domain-containing protein [Deltaproteobacteria bacterium]
MSPQDSLARREHFHHLLTTMQPYDTTESTYQKRMLDLLSVDGDPFSRNHFQPGHFTASSFVLHPTENKLLLIFHGKLHRWLQPGGHIDPEDLNVIEAARREVEEETGMTDVVLHQEGIFDIDIHEIPPLRQDPAHEHFDVRFLFRAQSPHFQAGSDAKDARWFSLDAINETESDQSVMRAVAKLSKGQ